MAKGYCPNCGSEIKLGTSPVIGQIVQCWKCHSRLKVEQDQAAASSSGKRRWRFK